MSRTFSDYIDSHQLDTILGKGWEPYVLYNLGWHWQLKKGPHVLQPRFKHIPGKGCDFDEIIGWTCYMNSPAKQHLGSGETMDEAILSALESFDRTLTKLDEALEALVAE